MAGTRGGIGRVLAMGIALALALLLVVAGEARAGKYAVAQCGWYVGADASWEDTSGGKFRSDGFCVPPAGADPFAGVHLKSLTREGGTVSGTRFGAWRWLAPPWTGITQVRGTWWHALHDGFEQRLGSFDWNGAFTPFLAAAATDAAPAEFVAGFPSPVAAIEDRLLCARAEAKACALEPGSWSALRALTITVQDDFAPGAVIAGGEAAAGGWHRGTQALVVAADDLGAGIRFAETSIDEARVALTEYPCAKAPIGSEWRATAMRPCPLEAGTTQWIPTNTFSDGPHALKSCQADFAGNFGCAAPRTILIDNNPPAHPRSLSIGGGEGWHRVDDFDLAWANPDQGPASPIVGAGWRLTGPGGYDSGARFAAGRGLARLAGISVPAPGAYALHLWLRDEAGNEAPAAALTVTLRFDDRPPTVAFAGSEGEAEPERLVAAVEDPLAGPASGQIHYRRADSERWLELPTRLLPGAPGQASLVAPVPELAPGAYLLRADVADAAGNIASTTLRGDGTRMSLRREAPTATEKAKTRLFARLGGTGRGRGDSLTVPFGAAAVLSGRLTTAAGAGIAGRELQVVSRPSRGALLSVARATVRTGERGGFELRLPAAPSRQVSVVFAGEDGLEPAHRRSLDLRVRSGVTLRAAPRLLANGETVTLSGRVSDRAAPIPRRGKLVAIQYREAETGRWRPVLVIRSDHDGRFHARYRFRYVSAAAAIRLRATALAEERWPYAPGSSPPVTVRVSG